MTTPLEVMTVRMLIDDLLNDIFADKNLALYAEFERWVRESRRYKEFVIKYRSKIRTKLKNVREEGGFYDVRAELETAQLLLREDRFTLEYEKYAASKQRGPDFTVTFKTHTLFNVEVRRIRGVELDDENSDARLFKLTAVLCDKIGQMPPGIINLLWLNTERDISENDLTSAMVLLRQLAERKTEEFFTRRGFDSAADFLKQSRHLSGIVLHQQGENGVWLNTIARHSVLPEIVTTLRRLNHPHIE